MVYVFSSPEQKLQVNFSNGIALNYDGLYNMRMTSVIDFMVGVTVCSYDKMGQLTAQISPLGGGEIVRYTYYKIGGLYKVIGTKGQMTEYTYTYDESGNITAIQGTGTTDTEEGLSRLTAAEMTYDAENHLLSYNDESSATMPTAT